MMPPGDPPDVGQTHPGGQEPAVTVQPLGARRIEVSPLSRTGSTWASFFWVYRVRVTRASLQLLLVEDDLNDATLLIEAFRHEAPDIQVTHLQSGDAALDLLGRLPQPQVTSPLPYLIVLDLNMPGMNGHEVLSQLKELAHLKHIPVVVMSGSDAPADILQAYQGWATSYVDKPFSLEGYCQLAHHLAAHWQDLVRIPGR
jgi:CheY-like chemotaxis protein